MKNTIRIRIALILLLLFMPVQKSHASDVQFIDKTVESGLSAANVPSYGLSWGDFNNDNCIDLYLVNHNLESPSLYNNLCNGTFADITVPAGLFLVEDFHGASWGDYDNDGDLDLYQTVGADGGQGVKENYFYQNNGNGTFTDITESTGLQDLLGRGRTPLWFDYNNDGLLDLFIANERRDDAPSRLFKNEGDGKFTEATEAAGLTGIKGAIGAHLADLNGDGAMDLIVSHPTAVLVYLNNQNATFSKYADLPIGSVTDIALGDYDNDGDTDIFATLGRRWGYDYYETDGRKLRYQLRAGSDEKGFDVGVDGSSIADFDIYLFENRALISSLYIGSGAYHPKSVPFSLNGSLVKNQGEPARTAPGIYIWYDLLATTWRIRAFATDGRPISAGILSTHGTIRNAAPYNLSIDSGDYQNILLNNQGKKGMFVDATPGSGLELVPGDARSAVFEDFDNDGDLDLYVVYTGGIYNKANRLYINDGQGHFTDLAEESGAQALVEGRGESVAYADYNNDGFVDLMISNGLGSAPFHAGQRVLLENQKNTNNWLQLRLAGVFSNRDGIGATATVEAGALRLTRQQTGGMHAFSQNSQILQFGLGDTPVIDRITIRWPNGITQQLSNIKVNQRLTVTEPKVSLSLTPDSKTVPRGGILGVQVTLTNHTAEQQVVYCASNLILPSGKIYPSVKQPLSGPIKVVLKPHETIFTRMTGLIPLKTLTGRYIYNAYVGKGPRAIWNEDHFLFWVTRF